MSQGAPARGLVRRQARSVAGVVRQRPPSTRRAAPGKKVDGRASHRRKEAFPEGDYGAVTAEFAVALPAVLLLLALLLAGSAAGITQLRLEEAARAGARALARGDSHAAVDGIVRRLAGDSASAAVTEDGKWITVTVSARVVGPFGSLIPWSLSATASARGEAPQPSASTAPLFKVGDGVVDFRGAVPMERLQTAVEEVAA
ncbi:TadE family type IV pilus minor pilin [Arthrobacter sp. SRS-W-1-2016]|uniref:TadE family type IV pilus minor pilin n=1 Tax=Arthrobacter sp. SRS-W-1-2016 TaxID=1930254 RepID=UPI0009911A65|nr:TadE family type IV pilus minor pilin [Arthrobacter sp. SRS-W-1-2016]